jgi:hypothetical protein
MSWWSIPVATLWASARANWNLLVSLSMRMIETLNLCGHVRGQDAAYVRPAYRQINEGTSDSVLQNASDDVVVRGRKPFDVGNWRALVNLVDALFTRPARRRLGQRR